VPKVKDARKSAGYALFLIAILYTTAPAIAVFSRTNLIETVSNKEYKEIPEWFKNWENTGLIAWSDKNGDGKIQYVAGDALSSKKPIYTDARGASGERIVSNVSDASNELYVDRDIMVLANPEIANLPNWVIGLVAAGGLAAALSTAAGLLLVISTSVSHDLVKKQLKPDISDKDELKVARLAIFVAILIAGYFGINPPGFVAAVVALAFGLAAASFFPAIILGIFDKRMNSEGAISGMVVGIVLMLFYMMKFKLDMFGGGTKEDWWFGTSPEGFGTIAMILNVVVSLVVSRLTPAPPQNVQDMVESIRIPSGAGEAQDH
jgi:cation/acetate symporter